MNVVFCKSIALAPKQPCKNLETLDHLALEDTLQCLASTTSLVDHFRLLDFEKIGTDVKLCFLCSQTGKTLLENAFRYSEQRAKDAITKLTWEVSLGEGGLYWASNACWSISAVSSLDLNVQLHYVADGIMSQLENRGK
ncbi:hypothetical protein DQE47_25000 [Salmonella enterica subsp. enterica serovar Weltevreden]|nr:hypothetical protein [Salmonella enterica subsp. enterica serovar Weltevreden]